MPGDRRPGVVVEGLAKSFGTVKAIAGIDFTVEPGTVLGLLGPNGAGKTTAVRILTTLLAPDAGRAMVCGYDVVTEAAEVRRSIGLAGQYAAVEETLTGRENLEMVGRLYHVGKAEARRRADDLLNRFDLDDAADRMVKGYSGGMRRRLDLAASLVGQPQVLFLDEPTTGLDPRSRIDLWEVIRKLVDEGTTLLLCTQYLEEADRLADRITVIDRGRVIAEGTTDELKSRVGGDVLEFRIPDLDRVGAAAGVVVGLGRGGAQVDNQTGQVVLPVGGDGSSVLIDVVRRLDAADVPIADLSLRRPTLDDVFLALTGRTAEGEAEGEEDQPPAGRRSRGRRGRDREASAARS